MKIDTNHILNKVYSTACLMLCYVVFFSCARVDLCESDNHTHLGGVSIVYDWQEIADSLRPDSMLLLVNRVMNNHHVGYVTGSESSVGGRYRFGKMYNNSEVGIYDESLWVSAGDYTVYAFNSDVDKKDTIYRFEYLNEYGDGQHLGEVSMDHIAIAYVGRELSEMRTKGYLYSADWHTVNPGFNYITTGIAPIYYAINDRNDSTQVFTFGVQVGKESKVTLTPKKMTQDITFSFPVYAEKQVVIDSVVAEISGIPHKMNFKSGELYIDTIYKMLFKMEVNAENVEEEMLAANAANDDYAKYECMSTISVMGLLPNKNAGGCIGAGILQVCLYASMDNGEGVMEKMAPQSAWIDLHNTIKKANLVIKKERADKPKEKYYVQNPREDGGVAYNDLLRIEDSRLIFATDGLVAETANKGESVDSWVVF